VRVVAAVCEPRVAVMVVVPVPALVASPGLPLALLTTATAVTDEVQVTIAVMSLLVPSL
jgi:uncharacterized protein YqhQ